MSSKSQLVIFDTLFVMVAEFERSYIELNFLHVTIKAGEGGGQLFRDLSLLFMSLFQGGGEGAGQLWTMSLILHFFFEVIPKSLASAPDWLTKVSRQAVRLYLHAYTDKGQTYSLN